VVGVGAAPSVLAHPLGNFSISQYTAIRLGRDTIELRYVVDLAEIPTFQEIQEMGIVPEVGHASLPPYLARKAESLREGLRLEIDDRRVPLRTERRDVIFPPGVGGLPTMKLGVVYRGTLPAERGARARLHYRDGNYPDRAGWKEIIAVAGPGATILSASVPARDRSRELSDYPTDLLDSPPQDREARLAFQREPAPPTVARTPPTPPASVVSPPRAPSRPPSSDATSPPSIPTVESPDLRLRPNRQATARSALADLVTVNEVGLGVVVFALAAAAVLGAFHALEPGHGKTVVAAYLVGSRGTAQHAVLLGLMVTASHTAGVYLLGGIALYASRYVVPERLYPWLGVFSGLVIAGLGFSLVLRRYTAGHAHGHGHAHDHPHDGHAHHHHHGADPHHHHHHDHDHPGSEAPVSLPALVALGVTGGIVPCPAAVVVLLSALSLNRVGFGLLLIVAFSAGLAAVLITIGVLMVYARRAMGRFSADGPVIRRWLPLASSAVITIVGVVITVQSLVATGLLPGKL
jgi:ABC-type nickel/cobalt efflux system permease component RcnA